MRGSQVFSNPVTIIDISKYHDILKQVDILISNNHVLQILHIIKLNKTSWKRKQQNLQKFILMKINKHTNHTHQVIYLIAGQPLYQFPS